MPPKVWTSRGVNTTTPQHHNTRQHNISSLQPPKAQSSLKMVKTKTSSYKPSRQRNGGVSSHRKRQEESDLFDDQSTHHPEDTVNDLRGTLSMCHEIKNDGVTSSSDGAMQLRQLKLRMWDFEQCDPKRCTGELLRFMSYSARVTAQSMPASQHHRR